MQSGGKGCIEAAPRRRAQGGRFKGFRLPMPPETGKGCQRAKIEGLRVRCNITVSACGLDCGGNMNEIMLNNMFKVSDEISDEVISQMQRRCCEENKQWKRRKRREEEAGGFDEEYNKRQRKYQNKPKWMKRRMNDADRAILLRAWAAI